jgi:hypothetical protein
METTNNKKIIQEEQLKKQEEYKEKVQDEMCKMVMRQTAYTYTEAKEKLQESNNNYLKVIQEYLGKTVKKEETKSVNQKIYKEIRTFMDYGAEKYEYQKKQQKKAQQFREKLIEEAKRRGLDKVSL